ncbi:MAG: DNA primase [Thermoplasmata archaeon]|nr:DNA primase [Thermoplasmata archaeon]
MNLDPSSTKYLIKASLVADGVVEKPDVVGAIFGQTEGLIGDELDLRDLQKTGRIGRIEVEITSKKGKSEGTILIPSSLDQVETVILAAALETVERVGPCKAKITVEAIEDVRVNKKKKIVERAKELLAQMIKESKVEGIDLTESVRQLVQMEEVVLYGEDKCPAGPNIDTSDAIIVVEGRSDVINLLKYGIKNVIAVGGTNIPETIKKLSTEKVVTAFVDGDRGGELILKELLQVAEIDFVARAPKNLEVEELTQKQIIKALRNKVPAEQYMEMLNIGKEEERKEHPPKQKKTQKGHETQKRDVEEEKKESSEGELTRYKDIMKNLTGTLKGMLIGEDGVVVKELPVRNLADELRKTDAKIHAVVFDGVISQRLLDIAQTKGIEYLIGSKKGNITKIPKEVKVLTKEDPGIKGLSTHGGGDILRSPPFISLPSMRLVSYHC